MSEAETAPSLIAGLSWKRRYQHVRDESCAVAAGEVDGSSAAQTCAVILVRSELRRRSTDKNATPPDFKDRNLTTRGTVAGSSEMTLYVSRSTALLIRASEDRQQSMDGTVALADGSNQVRYVITAKGRARIQLLPDRPQEVR